MRRSQALTCALVLSCTLSTVAAEAANGTGYALPRGVKPPIGLKANLAYHGGPVIVTPKVVFIFWGPSFSNAASPDYSYAQELRAYRNQLGGTPEFNVITQYSGIELANLGAGTPDWFDTSTPPANVIDVTVQYKVNVYLSLYPFNASAIYEVVLPSTSYSTNPSLGIRAADRALPPIAPTTTISAAGRRSSSMPFCRFRVARAASPSVGRRRRTRSTSSLTRRAKRRPTRS